MLRPAVLRPALLPDRRPADRRPETDTPAGCRHPSGTVQPATPFTTRDLLGRRARALAPLLDAATGLASLQRMYGLAAGADDFATRALETLEIGVACAAGDLEHIPAEGPLVIVANHPHGAADGLALMAAVHRVRTDVKLLGNELLWRIPEMRDHLVRVDAFRPGAKRNAAAVRAAVDWVQRGHVLVVFPAGEVSYVASSDSRIVDSAWRSGATRIATQAGSPVLPVFIEGRNSRLFVGAGRLHPVLRTALLARELLRLRGTSLAIHVGRAISCRRLASLGDVATRTAYLRVRCYGLEPGAGKAAGALRFLRGTVSPEPVAPAIPAERIAAEIDALGPGALVLENRPWAVYCAERTAAPMIVEEIGRLRELTFRSVGEGTGRARDLDRYDAHYRHLFVWHRDRRLIAGAYRVCATDRVAASRGLYTRSLFRYKRRLLEELGPALELGRSFVASEFQRDYQPLLLLWRGIGRLVAREPRYRRLFGPVSISADYGVMTRHILARFLLANRYSPDLGALVRPKHPLRTSAADAPDALVRSTVAGRLQDVEEIVRELEAGRRGIPLLLRQYLKLNARLLGFSVDPSFGHVLDGLVVVDLLDVERALLSRYLGNDGAASFLAWHRQPSPAVATTSVLAQPAAV